MNTQRLRTWLPHLRPSLPSIPSFAPAPDTPYPVRVIWQRTRILGGLALLCFIALTACGARATASTLGSSTPISTATSTPARAKLQVKMPNSVQNPYPYAAIEFDRGMPYAQAVRIITDLGLIPRGQCTSAGLGVGIKWQPADQSASYATLLPAPDGPSLWVFGPTPEDSVNAPSAPSDWLARLVNSSSTRSIYDEATNCPLLPGPAGTPSYLPPNTTFIYLRASFSTATSYDAALAAVINLGFRLAAPCYEQANPKPPWHSMGQEQSFAATQTLVLSTTFANSTQWHQQIAAVPGVTAIQAPYTAPC